jgi:AcrR family transcriptional regulator
MSTSKPQRKRSAVNKAESYHHGNLRQVLLETARELTNELGIDGFTLRELARRAGVSHAAPYNHFNDKAALIQALSIEAFTELANALRLAAAKQKKPLKALEAIGVAYVRFALEHPNEFRFIFRSDLRSNDGAGQVNQAGERAYAVLLEAVKICKDAKLLADKDLELLTLTAWSTSHGLATLLLNGPRQDLVNDLEGVEKIARGVIQTLQEGLFKRS